MKEKTRIKLNYSFEIEVAARMKAHCDKNDKVYSWFVNSAVKEKLEREERKVDIYKEVPNV